MTRSRPLMIGLTLALIATACSSGPSPEALAFCDHYIDLSSALGEGPNEEDPQAWVTSVSVTLEAMSTAPPDEIADAVEGVTSALVEPIAQLDEERFFAATESEEYQADTEVLNRFATSECDVASIEVTAIDYVYDADLEGLEPGMVAFDFSNEGTEFHEMALIRINDGVDATIQELLELPDEEAEQQTTFMGISFAAPGTGSTMFADLEEGRYVFICFIPTGSTSLEAAETAEGPPHFTQGMVKEFEVGA